MDVINFHNCLLITLILHNMDNKQIMSDIQCLASRLEHHYLHLILRRFIRAEYWGL